jgi:hypothetical protein
VTTVHTPVPELSGNDVSFGCIKHLPKWQDLPEEYRRRWSDRSFAPCSLIERWFYSGISKNDFPPPREGVDPAKARAALAAIIRSWDPKQEHKIAGAGFLANEWFAFETVKP